MAYKRRNITKIRRLVLHCTAASAKGAVTQTVEDIRNYHKNGNKWPDIAYHYVITYDGVEHQTNDLEAVSWHAGYVNYDSVGICYCGGGDGTNTGGKDTRTDAQKRTQLLLVDKLLNKFKTEYNIELTVHGHYEFASKACPSFNVEQWLVDTGLTNKYPWLANSENVKDWVNHGKTKCASNCRDSGVVKGSNPLASITNENSRMASTNKYNSPYQEQREALAKRISANVCNPLNVVGKGGITSNSLFASPFYYLQNGYNDESDTKIPKEDRKYVKTLLYLMSLTWNYDAVCTPDKKVGFFNNKFAEHGGVEMIPSGWAYLLGGIIWRSEYDKNGVNDPIAFGYYDSENNYHGLFYGRYKNLVPLLCKDRNNRITFSVVKADYDDNNNGYVFDESNFINQYMDVYIKNKLRNEFVKFADKYYAIIESLELKVNYINNSQSTQNNTNGTVNYVGSQSSVLGNSSTTSKPMTYSTCKSMINALSNNTLDNMLKILCGKQTFIHKNNSVSISGFTGHYAMGFYAKKMGGVMLYYHSKYSPADDLLNMTYGAPIIITTTGGNLLKENENPKTISLNNYKSYIEGFCDTLKYYVLHANETVTTGASSDTYKLDDPERDFKSQIYLYLKNFWDRWLCGFYFSESTTNNSYFSVNTFFNNFIFVDTFYNNIGCVLRLNCNELLSEYSGGDTNQSYSGRNIINHLGNVASRHMCAMFNFANYVDLKDVEKVKEMFTPLPNWKLDNPSIMNRFVVIYTHTANFLETNDRNKFNTDTFDIWSYDGGTSVAPSIFTTKSTKEVSDSELNEYQMAYKVPSFGVAYSMQDNSLWKNVKVGMDTQIVTEQVARAYSQIAEKGNSSKKKICFYGQDIYSIYQAYSYLVTVEMMGCAQIQPLMYFQLMNIPMFRGTYMIIKVEHNIKQGDMTTIFTGMKMSKVQPPFTKNWFTVPGNDNGKDIPDNRDTANNGVPIVSEEGISLDIEDNKLSTILNKYMGKTMYCDIFVKEVYKELGVDINGYLAIENGKNMYTEMKSNGEWKVGTFKQLQKKSNYWNLFGSRLSVGDVLFGYHNNEISGPQHHHVAMYLGLHEGHHFIAEGCDYDRFKSSTGVNIDKVRICPIETSMMSESSDTYVVYAKSTKAKIEQHNMKDTPISDENGRRETGVNAPGNAIITDSFVMIPVTNPIKCYTNSQNSQYGVVPSPSNSESIYPGSVACSQMAFTTGGKHRGLIISEGIEYKGSNTDDGYNYGGFIQYYDKSWRFCQTLSEYNDVINQDSKDSTGKHVKIRTAFRQYGVVKNGRKGVNFLAENFKNGKYIMRSLAEKDGKLYLVVSKKGIDLDTWEASLHEYGFKNALYSDSSGRYEYGWYKIQPNMTQSITSKVKDGVWYWSTGKEMPYNCTNFIIF